MSNRIYNIISNLVELEPINGRSSFYGKATMFTDEHNNKWLFSYNTPIAVFSRNKNMHRLWDGWSLSSGIHFATFCDRVNHRGYRVANKKYWDSLPVEDPDDLFDDLGYEKGGE